MNLSFIFFLSYKIILTKTDLEYEQGAFEIARVVYEKTDINLGGEDIIFLKTYIPMFFGKNKDEKLFILVLYILPKATEPKDNAACMLIAGWDMCAIFSEYS